MARPPEKVCAIVGGGIVGASVAYFLKEQGVSSIIIEKSGIACHSSGKAGGFLALDWQTGAEEAIGKASFALHKDFAETFGEDRIGYRHMKCVGLAGGTNRLNGSLQWLDRVDGRARLMGNETTLAQVHPKLLTQVLIEESQAKVIIDKVVNIEQKDNTVTSVQTESGTKYLCDYIFLAMGPWSYEAIEWFPSLKKALSNTVGPKYTSIIYDHSVDNTAVFLESRYNCEIYPRSNETYACGAPVVEPQNKLPDDPKEIVPTKESVEIVRKESSRVSTVLSKATIKTKQACYLPTSADGSPVLGHVNNTENAFIACGLTCWGILNAPACGKAMAELMLHGQCSFLDLAPFSPQRFE